MYKTRVRDGDVEQATLKRKLDKDWTGRTVKMRVRDKDGVMQAGTLGAVAMASTSLQSEGWKER
jgi:hypothetical protein